MFGGRGVSSYKVAEHPRLTATLPARLRLRGRDKVKEEIKGCGTQVDSALATTFNFLKRNEFCRRRTIDACPRAEAADHGTYANRFGRAIATLGRKQGRGKLVN